MGVIILMVMMLNDLIDCLHVCEVMVVYVAGYQVKYYSSHRFHSPSRVGTLRMMMNGLRVMMMMMK